MSARAALAWALVAAALLLGQPAPAASLSELVYRGDGQMPAGDSQVKVQVGQAAPDFALPAVAGGTVSLSDYRGKSNVLISFVPSAWTPVCSQQWPGYNLAEKLFKERDTVVLGISVSNLPSLYAWTKEMGGLWFPVLTDFWPHGRVASLYGVLRGDGMSERALFLVDKQGVVRWAKVLDINKVPHLDELFEALDKVAAP